MKHTEGKLTVNELNGIDSEKDGRIALALVSTTSEKCIANAERIVLTWNAHDELMSALKELLESGENSSIDLEKRRVGSRGIPSDESICRATELISQIEK